MEWPMKLLRELRELDQDFAWLTANRERFSLDNYSKLNRELLRRRAGLEVELDKHLDSV